MSSLNHSLPRATQSQDHPTVSKQHLTVTNASG
nr:MAG TPA: hypothetical protein [Caudoviricetes sp.]